MNVTVSVDLYMYNKIFFKKNKLKTQTLKFYCLNYTMKCLKGHASFLQFFSNIHAKFIKFYISNPWISQKLSLVPLS